MNAPHGRVEEYREVELQNDTVEIDRRVDVTATVSLSENGVENIKHGAERIGGSVTAWNG